MHASLIGERDVRIPNTEELLKTQYCSYVIRAQCTLYIEHIHEAVRVAQIQLARNLNLRCLHNCEMLRLHFVFFCFAHLSHRSIVSDLQCMKAYGNNCLKLFPKTVFNIVFAQLKKLYKRVCKSRNGASGTREPFSTLYISSNKERPTRSCGEHDTTRD